MTPHFSIYGNCFHNYFVSLKLSMLCFFYIVEMVKGHFWFDVLGFHLLYSLKAILKDNLKRGSNYGIQPHKT